MTTTPFDDIRALLKNMPSAAAAPPDPRLGRLGELAAFIKGWRGQAAVNRPIAALYAGSNGSHPDGVRARLEALAAGGATAARAAQSLGAGLEAFDLAIDRPVADMTVKAAMSERECAATMAFGMEALAKQPDLLIPVVLSDDDGAAAGAVALALFGGEATDWSGGPGPAAAVARLRGDVGDAPPPLEILRQLGSRPMAAVAGAILAARTQSVPVVLDGYAACAAAAALQVADPRALDHCVAGHVSAHAGHGRLLAKLGLTPILDLALSGEDGLGGLAALQVIRTACAAAV